MKKIFVHILLLPALVLFFTATAGASPQVLVSIKPLHSLVAGVMDGVATPQLLVKGGGSPHGYTLRPSEARALSRADLVVWVGPELESFLVKPLTTLGKQAHSLELEQALRDSLLNKRRTGTWEAPAHHHKNSHGTATDLHLWLDPKLAQKIVALTADTLIQIDPDHQQQYRTNRDKVIARLQRLDTKLKEQLAPYKGVPYIVFHAAYQYFEAAYGLTAVGSITIDPERKPGAKRVKEIRDKIIHLKARCVFSEPQFKSQLVATIIKGTGAKTGTLDPLGADLEAGPDAYFQLLRRLGDNLVDGVDKE
jgi:zinc transport system substrate-binding protein